MVHPLLEPGLASFPPSSQSQVGARAGPGAQVLRLWGACSEFRDSSHVPALAHSKPGFAWLSGGTISGGGESYLPLCPKSQGCWGARGQATPLSHPGRVAL